MNNKQPSIRLEFAREQIEKVVMNFNESVIQKPQCYYTLRYDDDLIYLDRHNYGLIVPVGRLSYTGYGNTWEFAVYRFSQKDYAPQQVWFPGSNLLNGTIEGLLESGLETYPISEFQSEGITNDKLPPDYLALENQRSWKQAVKFWNSVRSGDGRRYESIYLLVRYIASTVWAERCRAGQSMFTLVISTAEWWGFYYSQPYLAIDVVKEQDLQVQYHGDTQENHVIESSLCATEENTFLFLKLFLIRLWNETRGKNT